MDTRYPSAETVFEYSVDVKNRQWLSWDSKLSGSFKPRPDIPAYRLLVPTVDTVRTTYLTNTLVRSQRHTLVVGGVGVGKTMTLQAMLEALPGNIWSSCTINLSAQTSSNSLQVGTAVMLWSAQAAKAACMQCACAHKQLAVHSQNSTLQLHPTDIVHVVLFLPQDMIEGKLEKRAKGMFVPAGGKRLIAFIDDLNMPKKSKFGFIPPLELLKLWVDNGFW